MLEALGQKNPVGQFPMEWLPGAQYAPACMLPRPTCFARSWRCTQSSILFSLQMDPALHIAGSGEHRCPAGHMLSWLKVVSLAIVPSAQACDGAHRSQHPVASIGCPTHWNPVGHTLLPLVSETFTTVRTTSVPATMYCPLRRVQAMHRGVCTGISSPSSGFVAIATAQSKNLLNFHGCLGQIK